MKNILAIGTAAASITYALEKYDIYNIYKIANSIESNKNSFAIPEYSHPEEYEKLVDCEKIGFLKKIKNQVSVFVCGASLSSAVTLRVLEILHKNRVRIEVAYFMPETHFLSEEQILQEKTCRNILQQYARSGLLNNLLIVSNKELENFSESSNVYEYFNDINRAFCDSLYMLDVFKGSKPIMSTFSRRKETSRIRTIGVSTIECEDNIFFSLDNCSEIFYYFGINEIKLKSDSDLFRNLTEKLKKKITSSTRVYFGIYPTQYENDYVYVEKYSSRIQLID